MIFDRVFFENGLRECKQKWEGQEVRLCTEIESMVADEKISRNAMGWRS